MIAEKLFLSTLEKLRHGCLEVIAPSGRHWFGDRTSALAATVHVHNSGFFQKAVFGGDDGAGDSFVDGDWSSPDLVSLVRVVVRNLEALRGGSRWASAVSRAVHRIQHLGRRNTIDGSRRNIAAHYDLSNDFFRLFLSRDMMYSCAVFGDAAESLERAQLRKLDMICKKLDLGPGDHVLEIGTGWGGFAEYAAVHYGCRITTTTISRQQHDAAQERFQKIGAAGERITLLLEDYRNLQGRFDKLVSIEMFEAVGLEHYDAFFTVCDRLLKADGSMLIQTITMNEQRFSEYHRDSDWIQRRIFPGGELASISEMLRSAGRKTWMTLVDIEDIGIHYALTLREWRRRFHDRLNEVRRLGFDDRFIRTWDYYLAYCEGAFLERYVGDSQLVFTKIHNPRRLAGEPRIATGIETAYGQNVLTEA